MADQGTIGIAISHDPLVYATPNYWSASAASGYVANRAFQKPLPVWKGTNFTGVIDANGQPGLLGTDTNGLLSGTVTVNGTPVQNAWVLVYYRQTGQLIARTRSAADGTWSLRMFETGQALYHIVALTPDAYVNTYNSLIYDQVLPV